jgi:hypothetical protein
MMTTMTYRNFGLITIPIFVELTDSRLAKAVPFSFVLDMSHALIPRGAN